MINNNRQNGRRRGRGGGPRSPNQAPNMGNGRDIRQRGNAPQLLEKYKALARDAQMQGDRVQAEYYLQFAEHYYRVLGESRARFDEQRRQRDDYGPDEEDGEEDGNYAGGNEDDQSDRPARAERQEQGERPYRDERPARDERPMREDRPQREERMSREDRPQREERPREDRPVRAERGDYRPERNGESRPSRGRLQPRRDEEGEGDEGGERISLEVLPPAIAADNDVAKPVRRRARRPREDDDIAPAA